MKLLVLIVPGLINTDFDRFLSGTDDVQAGIYADDSSYSSAEYLHA